MSELPRYRVRITMLGWEVRDYGQKPSANVSFHKTKGEAEAAIKHLEQEKRRDARYRDRGPSEDDD